ncbi:MAG: hypothetical protein ACR2QA_18625 [Solirubrobacteraceae bacterium]
MIAISIMLAVAVSACGGGATKSRSAAAQKPVSTPAQSTTSSGTSGTPVASSPCAATAVAATPTGSTAGAPSLKTLLAHLHSSRFASFAFTQRTCVGSGPSPMQNAVSASMQVRPSLMARITQTSAGHVVNARLIGGTEYVHVPGLASRDGGRPWLSVSLARAGAAIGLNLNELLSEAKNLDPSRNLRLLTVANQFQPLGATNVNGTAVVGFRGSFDAAHLPASGLSSDLTAQVRALLARVGASREVVSTYITPTNSVPVRVVTTLDTKSHGEIVTVQDFRAINVPVHVAAPPPRATISYSQAQRLGR